MRCKKTTQQQIGINLHCLQNGFTNIIIFGFVTFFLCLSNNSTCKDSIVQVPWTVVGAGPTGIAAVGLILDNGVPADKIIWIDPEFNVGRMGKYYKNVPGNATVRQYITFLEKFKIFSEVHGEALDRLFALPLDQTPKLQFIVEPLLDITNYLCTKVLVFKDKMIALDFHDDQWYVQTNNASFCSDNVVLATGSHPKAMSYHGITEIPLDLAVDKDVLATYVKPEDTVAVVGSAHSALLIVKYLTELPVASIINFYKKPITYTTPVNGGIAWLESGLKGELAIWAKTVLEFNPPKNLLRIECTSDNFQSLLSKCTKLIYAIGFERNDLPPINGDPSIYAKYDFTSGMIAPRLFGFGIAFPQQRIDPLGNIEYLVGIPHLSFTALRTALNKSSEKVTTS